MPVAALLREQSKNETTYLFMSLLGLLLLLVDSICN